MRSAQKALPAIVRRIARGERCILFLDFDGTLAPIVQDPTKAAMSARTKRLVEACARKYPLYIVSGRSLRDIRARAAIAGVGYAGNHGREWVSSRGTTGKPVAPAEQRDIEDAYDALRALPATAGAAVEDKGISVAFHYRRVATEARPRLLRRAREALAPILERGRVEVLHQKKLLDIRPKGWHKGDFVSLALRQMKGSHFGVFIGDDRTDEDAFRALRDGISIRVGRSTSSSAAYYVEDVGAVDDFLQSLLDISTR